MNNISYCTLSALDRELCHHDRQDGHRPALGEHNVLPLVRVVGRSRNDIRCAL